ncbi:lysozyme inhibitor LprI family protein [Phaeovulum sp.]|uniref:lysozyme inhibitor LprI family protein n=1 Tax=Phaeovulum sp. TaxID=2934796 RepID=UPI0039E51C46
MKLWSYKAVWVIAFLCSAIAPVHAQQLLDSYTAVISIEDRVNSKGSPLTSLAQILAQDRANVHRFGIRQQGDVIDATFGSSEARGRFAELLARGMLGPGVAEAIARGSAPLLNVQVYGSAGRPYYLSVTLADSGRAPNVAPSYPVATNGQPGMGKWSYILADVDGTTIASLNLERDGELLVTMRCAASLNPAPVLGIDPRAGVLTLQFSPTVSGPYTGYDRSIGIALGSSTSRQLPMTFEQSVGVYFVRMVLRDWLRDAFDRGAKLSINSQQAGRLDVRIPQPEARALASACRARGVDPAVTPGFDCTKAGNAVEDLICTLPHLAELDQKLTEVFASAPENLRASQQVWIEARNGCRTNVACIEEMTSQRIALLGNSGPLAAENAPVLGAVPSFADRSDKASQSAAAPMQADSAGALIGTEALLDRFLLWSIAQNPHLAAEKAIQYRLLAYDFPPDLPEVAAAKNMGWEAQARIEALAPRFANAPPVSAVIEQPMTIRYVNGDPKLPLQPSGGTVDLIGDAAAITRLILPDHKFSSGFFGLTLNLDKPFYLPIPQSFTPVPDGMIGPNKGKTLVRIAVTLSDHLPNMQGNIYHGGSARAVIHSVTFVYRPVIRDDGPRHDGPDQILHVWQGGDAANVNIARPTDALETARIYGGGASSGRYVVNSRDMNEAMGEVPDALLRKLSSWDALLLATKLTVLTTAQPERTLDPEVAELVMRALLSDRERADLFPLKIATAIPGDQPSELELRAALTQNEVEMRQRVIERSPALPLALRYIGRIALGKYDFETAGFPLSTSFDSVPWLPSDSRGQQITRFLPDFLPVAPEAAQALLDSFSHDGSGGRERRFLTLVIDYSLDTLSTRTGRSGAISMQEVGSVRPSFAVSSIRLYSGDDLSRHLYEIAVPDGFAKVPQNGAMAGDAGAPKTGDALPDELFLTTGKSLLAAIDRLDVSGEIMKEAIKDVRAISPSPQSTYEARKAAFRQELRQMARDSYWIGASFKLGPYDADQGGFPIVRLGFTPVGHSEDFDGVEAPPIRGVEQADYAFLRVPAEFADEVASFTGNKRATGAYIKVHPVGAVYDRDEGQTLVISAPSEVIFDKAQTNALPLKVDIRVALDAPARLGAAFGQEDVKVAPPDALMLDPEGLDLLALSLAPETFDDKMFRRMLVDRLLKERDTKAKKEKAGEGTAPPLDWRRFFANPDQPLRASAIDALLPEFRSWSLARAAALPDVLLLPTGNINPISGCRGLRVLRQPDVEMNFPFLLANISKILRPDVTLTQGVGNSSESGRSRAGPDVVWWWEGGGRFGSGLDCKYVSSGLRSLDKGIRPDNASYVSTLVVVREQPSIGGVTEMPDSIVYKLSIDDIRFVPSTSLSQPPDGLVGFVVLTSQVEAAEGFRRDQFGGGYKSVGRTEKGDWDAIVATPPESLDILGLTLEMPLAEFESSVRERMPGAALYTTDIPGKSMFGHASALIDPATGESLVAVYADHVKDKPVIALMRRLELDPSEVSLEGLKLSLQEKYGAAISEHAEDEWYWGALPEEEDTWGYCGAPSLLHLQDLGAAPAMVTEDAAAFGDKNPVRGNQYWSELGWPDDFEERPGRIPDISQCAPLVAVNTGHSRDKLIVVIWLFDRALAERLDAQPRPAAAKAKIEL